MYLSILAVTPVQETRVYSNIDVVARGAVLCIIVRVTLSVTETAFR